MLINDGRPWRSARALGIQALNVAQFVVLLAATLTISRRKASIFLDSMDDTTADIFLDEARRRLASLSGVKWGEIVSDEY